jgi:chromosome segregation ATPase
MTTAITDKLRAAAEEAKTEFQNLQADVEAIPGQLAEIEKRLKTSTDEKVIKTFRKRREELKEDAEVKPLLARGAQIRYLRAASAHAKALAQEVGAGYNDARQAEQRAKAELEAAQERASEATALRESIERRSGQQHSRAQTLAAEAEDLERDTARAA